jgi:HK97 family phage portal protein
MSLLNPLTWFAGLNTGSDIATKDFSGFDFETKASSAGSLLMPYGVGRPVWTERDYENFALEAYQLNAIGYRCAKMIAQAASSPKWLLHDAAGKEIESHPLLDLLARPSPASGGAFFFESVYTYLMLSGNSYIEKVGPNRGAPTELWSQRPDRMQVIAGKYGTPSAFRWHLGGKEKTWPVNPITGQGDILHLREFHPLDDWYGLSRVEPAHTGIDRNNAAAAHNKALLDNGARPSGALIFETVSADGQNISAPPEIIEKAERELKKRHGGPSNAGTPMVLGGNVKWEEMGLSPKDMDFNEGKLDSARDICVAWGVPHVLIVKGAATFNNIKEAKLELYEETVLPLISTVVDELNVWLVPLFGDGLTLSVDLDSIPSLEPRREIRRKTYTDLLDKGVLDVEEVREALQYGPRNVNSLRTINAPVLAALIASVPIAGMTPLLRYMKSVGLFDPTMTEAQVVEAALGMVEDEPEPDDDLLDIEPDPENEDEDETDA